MKFKHKKLFISGTAVAAAGVLGAGALLQSVLSVQASSEMMPGIETIVSENTEDDPFRILELVDSSENAEIGYYISGQEPSLKLYQYQYTDADGNTQTVHFSTIKDALSKLPEKYRMEFVMNVRLNDSGRIDESISTGIKKIRDAAGDDSSKYPLSLSDYQEKYFLSDGDDASDWTKVDLTDFDGNSRTDTVTVNGSYVENTAGTGDYTKGDQEYYPIRNDVDADKKQSEKFRENIQSFEESTSSDARGAYYLEFTEVLNTKINNALADENDKGQKSLLPEYDYANGRYGYYENVYTTLTKEIAEQIDNKDYQFPGEKPNKVDESKAVLVRDIPAEAVKTTSTVTVALTGKTVRQQRIQKISVRKVPAQKTLIARIFLQVQMRLNLMEMILLKAVMKQPLILAVTVPMTLHLIILMQTMRAAVFQVMKAVLIHSLLTDSRNLYSSLMCVQ